MSRLLSEILNDYRKSSAAVQAEEQQRATIMASDAFQAQMSALQLAKETMAAMLTGISDSVEELEADKKELQEFMQKNQIYKADEFTAKTRAIRTVDTRKVLEAMQGDIDNLMLVSSVKIKDLEEFCRSNPEYKKDLKSCIVDTGYVVTDILVQESAIL